MFFQFLQSGRLVFLTLQINEDMMLGKGQIQLLQPVVDSLLDHVIDLLDLETEIHNDHLHRL